LADLTEGIVTGRRASLTRTVRAMMLSKRAVEDAGKEVENIDEEWD